MVFTTQHVVCMTKNTLKRFSLSIKSASLSLSNTDNPKSYFIINSTFQMPFLQGITNMDIFHNNKCKFSFLEIALILLPSNHKLTFQVYFSYFFSKILLCSSILHDSSSTPCIYVVFTIQHVVLCVRQQLLQRLIQANILNLQIIHMYEFF